MEVIVDWVCCNEFVTGLNACLIALQTKKKTKKIKRKDLQNKLCSKVQSKRKWSDSLFKNHKSTKEDEMEIKNWYASCMLRGVSKEQSSK